MWKLLIVLVLAMQVCPPVPGQQAGTAGNRGNNASTKTKGEKSIPAGPVTVKPLDETPNPQGTVKPVAPENKEQAVKLTDIPPITIIEKEKTWRDHLFDWGPWAFALCLVIVGSVQTCAMIWQARLLRDTRNKIETQANLMKDQLDDSRASGIASSAIASGTLTAIQTQAQLMGSQLQEMQASSQQAARHLSLTERPWISPKLELLSGLTADENGIRVTLGVSLINLGKTPAIGMWGSPGFYFMPQYKPFDLGEEVRRRCQPLTETVSWGRIVFPDAGESNVEKWVVHASADEIEKTGGNGWYSAMILVCVGYRSTVDENARHYTAILYDFAWIGNPELPGKRSMLRKGVSLPIDQLSLVRSPLFGPVAE